MSAYLRDFLCSIIRPDLACSHLFKIRSYFQVITSDYYTINKEYQGISGTWMSGYLRQKLCSIIRSDLACSQNTEIGSIFRISGTWMSGYLRDFLCSIIRSDLACSRNLKIGSIFSSVIKILEPGCRLIFVIFCDR